MGTSLALGFCKTSKLLAVLTFQMMRHPITICPFYPTQQDYMLPVLLVVCILQTKCWITIRNK